MANTTLETIYKKTKTGAIQQSIISFGSGYFHVEFGQVDGKQQVQSTECFTTNAGRSNERNADAQAEFEALALHAKKIKSGYVLDKSGESDIRLPMKVKVIQDQWDNIIYPCASTAKLNGVNGTYRLINDKLLLTSRGGDPFPEIPHLNEQIREVMAGLNVTELNGELYIHGEHLQDIQSAVTKTKPLSASIEFAIFDTAEDQEYQVTRQKMVNFYESYDFEYISFLTGVICNNKQDVDDHYDQCMSLGLEGTVVKNLTGIYKHGIRSSDQFKYKKALDAEYEVVGFNLDKYGHAVWVCVTPEGEDFKAKQVGDNKTKLEIAKHADDYIGKWLKVEYEMLSKKLKPLKPVGQLFRDCDANGNPLC